MEEWLLYCVCTRLDSVQSLTADIGKTRNFVTFYEFYPTLACTIPARRSQGDSYLAERAGMAAADQPVTTPPTNRMPMSSLAVATMAINDTIDDVIDEMMTSTSGDESIVLRRLTKDPNPTKGEGQCPRS